MYLVLLLIALLLQTFLIALAFKIVTGTASFSAAALAVLFLVVFEFFRVMKACAVSRVSMRIRKFKQINFYEYEHVFCVYCSKELTMNTATVDHIVPRALGGTGRLVLCCQQCNVRKGDMPYMSFVKEIDRDLRGTEAEG